MNKQGEGRKYNFYHEKIEFISSSRLEIFFLLYRRHSRASFNLLKAVNDVINTLTSADMENMPLGCRMHFHMSFRHGTFSVKQSCLYYR